MLVNLSSTVNKINGNNHKNGEVIDLTRARFGLPAFRQDQSELGHSCTPDAFVQLTKAFKKLSGNKSQKENAITPKNIEEILGERSYAIPSMNCSQLVTVVKNIAAMQISSERLWNPLIATVGSKLERISLEQSASIASAAARVEKTNNSTLMNAVLRKAINEAEPEQINSLITILHSCVKSERGYASRIEDLPALLEPALQSIIQNFDYIDGASLAELAQCCGTLFKRLVRRKNQEKFGSDFATIAAKIEKRIIADVDSLKSKHLTRVIGGFAKAKESRARNYFAISPEVCRLMAERVWEDLEQLKGKHLALALKSLAQLNVSHDPLFLSAAENIKQDRYVFKPHQFVDIMRAYADMNITYDTKMFDHCIDRLSLSLERLSLDQVAVAIGASAIGASQQAFTHLWETFLTKYNPDLSFPAEEQNSKGPSYKWRFDLYQKMSLTQAALARGTSFYYPDSGEPMLRAISAANETLERIKGISHQTSSKDEQAFGNFLDWAGLEVTRQYYIGGYCIDFLVSLPSHHVALEFDGPHHFVNQDMNRRCRGHDKLKDLVLSNGGLKVVRISIDEWKALTTVDKKCEWLCKNLGFGEMSESAAAIYDNPAA